MYRAHAEQNRACPWVTASAGHLPSAPGRSWRMEVRPRVSPLRKLRSRMRMRGGIWDRPFSVVCRRMHTSRRLRTTLTLAGTGWSDGSDGSDGSDRSDGYAVATSAWVRRQPREFIVGFLLLRRCSEASVHTLRHSTNHGASITPSQVLPS